jgi:uncharacterized protein (TIGR00730 family)
MTTRNRHPPQSARRAIPAPPLHERRIPLPWHKPKPGDDDREAPERVRRLLASPSYKQADEDLAFLRRPDMLGVRLHLDYWKAEALLDAHGIEHTIVVFGSTRIPEPAEARRRLDTARSELAAKPDDPHRQTAARIAERVHEKSRYYEAAREFGRIVGQQEHAPKVVIMTGGGPGIMEAANRGAFDADAPSVGLNISLPHAQFPNPYLTPELCFRFHYFGMRKLHFVQRARALVVFPGGYGTMDELFDTLALVQTRKIAPVPVVLVGERFWRRAVNFDFLVDEGVIDAEDLELFWFAETAEDTWAGIEEWYLRKGEPLLARTPPAAPGP